ncbi:MAG: AAA family ATPase, partial [Acidimicrobiales bacterium]|nr:AAA family ATPase [Acidimicrobiales bacterium]
MQPMPSLARSDIDAAITERLATCAVDGAGSIVLLSGEAGIGKSTMARAAIDTARGGGHRTWMATARVIDQATAFSLFEGVRSGTGDPLLAVSLLVGAPSVDGEGFAPRAEVERVRATEELLAQVEVHCQQPMLLVLEDLHLADDASLDASGRLAELTINHPLVLLLTHQSGHRRDGLDRLIEHLRGLAASEFVVPPLSEVEVEELLPELCGGPPGAALQARAQGAAGNPFLLEALATGLLEEGSLVTRDELVDTENQAVPQSLVDAVGRQLRRLGADVAELLRAASVHGPVVDIDA